MTTQAEQPAAETPATVIELPRTYTVSEVLALTGAKYRFIDYAIRAGYLDNDTAKGSGTQQRRFTETEIDTVYAAKSLIEAGFTVAAAFDIGKALIRDGHYEARPGLIYTLTLGIAETNPTSTEETPA